jgi:hypothetical protein
VRLTDGYIVDRGGGTDAEARTRRDPAPEVSSVACHEAGRAVMARKLGLSLHSIRLNPASDTGPVDVLWPSGIIPEKELRVAAAALTCTRAFGIDTSRSQGGFKDEAARFPMLAQYSQSRGFCGRRGRDEKLRQPGTTHEDSELMSNAPPFYSGAPNSSESVRAARSSRVGQGNGCRSVVRRPSQPVGRIGNRQVARANLTLIPLPCRARIDVSGRNRNGRQPSADKERSAAVAGAVGSAVLELRP